MNYGIWLYRTATVVWTVLMASALAVALVGNIDAASSLFVGSVAVLVLQVVAFRCKTCGSRPGVMLLSVGTLVDSYEHYIADAVMLRRCPNCETHFISGRESRGNPWSAG